MSESYRNIEELQSQNIHRAIISRGLETQIMVSENAIHAENNQGNIGFLLDEPEAIFVSTLAENPNRAFLISELRLLSPGLQSYSAARLYSSLTGKFGPNITRDNFIAFGHGSAKRYGFIINSKDPSELIRMGRRSIELSEYSERRKNKQLRSYDELEAFYNGSEERKYSRNKLLGATALGTTITVGGSIYLIYKKSHTE